MRIVFTRGWGPFMPDVVHDVAEPLAEIHIRAGRARLADAAQLGKTDDAQAGADEDDDVLTDAEGEPRKKPSKSKKPAK